MNKTFLLALLQEAYDAEQTLIASLPAGARAAAGTLERWSAKDLLAHIAAWQARAAQALAAAAQHTEPPDLQQVDAFNAQIFEENRQRPWHDVVVNLAASYAQLAANTAALAHDALFDPERIAWCLGEPLAQLVQDNGYSHPALHLARFYLERGEPDRAIALQESVAARLSGPDAAPGDRAAASYNLACFYALAGRPAQAIPLLSTAFAASPDVKQFARQDPDLGALRGLPEFEALFP